MSETIGVGELLARLRAAGFRTDRAAVAGMLEHWRETGVVAEVLPGRYHLTGRGRDLAEWVAPRDDAEGREAA